ncbi:MAG TPA: ABC transporter substrate-binding protein [Xanthobacteraceae bacterium]|nr:ABC transporter substrate-binding protein [Xanthobacteraceae bacterium]
MSDEAGPTHRGKHARPRRRDVLAALAALGGLASSPQLARAQQRRLPAIGYLYAGSLAAGRGGVEAFRAGLAEMGYVEGRNVAIEFREADNDIALLPQLARDLVARGVDVIVTPGSGWATLAAKDATSTIPIVFSNAGNPIQMGVVPGLSHPGGNVTGISDFGNELSGKRVELTKLLVPAAATIGLLVTANHPDADREVSIAQEHARAIGIEVFVLSVSSVADIDAAFATLARKNAGGFCLVPNALFVNRRAQVIALAARYRIPAMYPFIQFTEAGGLMSYGSSLTERNRQTGIYVGLILNGRKPADLPVFRLEKFELAINMTTAKTLGLTVPATFLALVDKVIE